MPGKPNILEITALCIICYGRKVIYNLCNIEVKEKIGIEK